MDEDIDEKEILSYDINIPIFNDELTYTNKCKYLLENYNHIIVYCNSCNEGKLINDEFNKLQNNSSKYIDCNTSKKERKEILKEYKQGNIQFLVNVRILVEGFDAPITKGVCFIHLPSTNTATIQIIGRALRLHNLKKIAHVILPFSIEDDEKEINNFIRILMKNDNKCYFEVNNIINNVKNNVENKQINEIINNKFELLCNKIYSSVEIPIDKNELWMVKLNKVMKFIDEHKKRPSEEDKNNYIQTLGIWVSRQRQCYKNKIEMMRTKIIYDKWTEFINNYRQHFLTNEEKWFNNLNILKQYIDDNNKLPSKNDDDDNIKILGIWTEAQQNKYKNKIYIMKNEMIYNEWEKFIVNYKHYFLSKEEKWYANLNATQQYINENKKLPSMNDNYENISFIGLWIHTQHQNCKNKRNAMENEKIFNDWIKFKELNEDYFMTGEEKWNNKLHLVQQYIDNNKCLPKLNDKNNMEKKLNMWLNRQLNTYKERLNIMSNDIIYNKWMDFMDKNKKYFLTNEEKWFKNYKDVQKYIDENDELPNSKSNNYEIRFLGSWMADQKKNFNNKSGIMNVETIKTSKFRDKWIELVLHNKKYFTTYVIDKIK